MLKSTFYRDLSIEINVENIIIKMCLIKLLFPVKRTNHFNVANFLRSYIHNQKCIDLILTEAKRRKYAKHLLGGIPEVQ